MRCPRCGHVQDGDLECVACGVIFSRVRDDPPPPSDGQIYEPQEHSPLARILDGATALEIEQEGMDMVEVIVGFERANEYSITALSIDLDHFENNQNRR